MIAVQEIMEIELLQGWIIVRVFIDVIIDWLNITGIEGMTIFSTPITFISGDFCHDCLVRIWV
tara:strand:- start:1961 stop:2149 length:189 start_codon:yes stop_codon:yes gene_type:complete